MKLLSVKDEVKILTSFKSVCVGYGCEGYCVVIDTKY
jgi:hypothetical protein